MAIIKSRRCLAGAHVAHYKNTTEKETKQLPLSKKVTIPLLQHMGAPCEPLVKKGDHVCTGQKIGDNSAFFSVPVHASCSGVVEDIVPFTNIVGITCKAVVIAVDEVQEQAPVSRPVIETTEQFLAAVRESGLVGLGGAGFPAHVKFGYRDIDKVDTLVVNAAECEPYITADYRTCIESTQDIVDGVRAICKFLNLSRVFIGIEDNKAFAMEVLDQAFSSEDHVTVVSLPSVYPQGAEKSIIYATTGITVPRGKLPADCGVIVSNVSSVAHLGRYLKTGMPLIEKRITVDGDAVSDPQNLMVRIGTPVRDVLAYCHVSENDCGKVLMGGPMMGSALADIDAPIVKNNNAVTCFQEKSSLLPKTTACIRCSKCIGVCPMRLMPAKLEKAYDKRDAAELENLCVDLCINCGCCSFVCPAKRHLAQKNQLAKAFLKEQNSKEDKKA